jgi:predicted AlkP superfamily pyrophosphatase or phosphodiesterase
LLIKFIKTMPNKGKKKKVLILGLDGLRADAWQAANTPNLDKLSENGVYSTDAMTEIDTVSGACWTALLKGVHCHRHGVVGNNFSGIKSEFETIFKIAKDYNSKYKCVANSNWKPIIKKIFEKGVLDKSKSSNDKTMAWRTAKDIEKDRGDLYFVQLDDCDHAGHSHEYRTDSPKYMEQVETTDGLVGKIMESVYSRLNDEDWLICVVSDHGGNGKSHGGPTYGELNIVFIVSGDSVKNKGLFDYDEDADEEGTLMPKIIDMVPTIAEFLSIPKKDYWDGENRAVFE